MNSSAHPPARPRSIFAWCLYDWANSAFNTVIITFVFSVYFARSVVGDETLGSAIWGYAIAASGFSVAVLAPIGGAVADHYGARKKWLGLLTAVTIAVTFGLFWGAPEGSPFEIVAILALLVLANTAFELALVFYNAMLPTVAPAGMIGRVSGWAWGLGYFGGLACLAVALFGLIGIGDARPFLSLPEENALNVRTAAILAGLWFAVFALPLFFWTEDAARTGLSLRDSVRAGASDLLKTARSIRSSANLIRFLIASALYRDGLATVFAMGGLYAAAVYGMGFDEILLFAIALNVSAGVGAVSFAFLDDHAGSKLTAIVSLCGLILTGCMILLTMEKAVFMALAVVLGLFVGPAQAAGRSLAGRLAPPDAVTQIFGLYAFTGKSIAFLGPLSYGLAVQTFEAQQAGMATILMFWISGLVLLLTVREKPDE